MPHSNKELLEKIEATLARLDYYAKPAELYDPIRYFLKLGGKRIRPVLVLMACEAVGGDIEQALNTAAGFEVFHNFTLMHDDIMDRAPLRRGQQTVHEKWNPNIAILAGDTMFVKSVMLINSAPEAVRQQAMELFLHTAVEVCEGQQYDMNYENMDYVRVAGYLEMIRLKTSVLLAAALQTGALIGGADEDTQDAFYEFGEKIGLAFQLQDDLLDTYADANLLGKQIGGDILSDKKTFLWLKAIELGSDADKLKLIHLSTQKDMPAEEKIKQVKEIFDRYSIKMHTEMLIKEYFDDARRIFEEINLPEKQKAPLLELAESLYQREF